MKCLKNIPLLKPVYLYRGLASSLLINLNGEKYVLILPKGCGEATPQSTLSKGSLRPSEFLTVEKEVIAIVMA